MTLPLMAVLLCLSGFGALASTMERHRPVFRVTAWTSPQRIAMRATGYALLAASLWPCIAVWGPYQGPVGWFGVLSAGAAAVLCRLRYANPRRR